MVPVRLSLSNFLSYGTANPPLEFAPIQVACLSGGNGQGKSALLDAITWVLWGQARKGIESRKADEELIRIGTREMQVELVFDLEGERYRVQRGYYRSATGKTNKSKLEIAVFDADSGEFHPLTQTALRDSQARLDQILGLDYETFINSAFLLQGRSDEFTKKKPAERKNILAGILNLQKYDKLADLARRRQSEATEILKRTDQEMIRLEVAVAQAADWETKKTTLQTQLTEAEGTLTTLQTRETELTERLAASEAQAKHVAALTDQLANLAERQEKQKIAQAELAQKIAAAEQLMTRAATIKADHARYETLNTERAELDEKRELLQGLQHRIETLQRDLQTERTALETKIHRAEMAVQSLQHERNNHQPILDRAEDIETQWQDAQTAKTQVETTQKQALQYAALTEQIAAQETEQDKARMVIETERTARQKHLDTLAARLQEHAHLTAEIATYTAQKNRFETLTETLKQTKEQGQQINTHLAALESALAQGREDLTRLQNRQHQLQTEQAGACPLCGTELDAPHRAHALQTVDADVQVLQEKLAAQTTEIEAQGAKRHALRMQYKSLETEHNDLAHTGEKLARLQEQARQFAQLEQEHQTLQHQLAEQAQQNGQWAAPFQAAIAALKAEQTALQFDPTTHAENEKRAQMWPLRDKEYQDLRHAENEIQRLDIQLEKKQHDLAILRQKLDDPATFKTINDTIETVQKQVRAAGYNGARHTAVRQELQTLQNAGTALSNLANAQENHAAWSQQHTQMDQELADLLTEQTARTEERAALQTQLTERATWEADHARIAAQRRAQQHTLQQFQHELGQYEARLAQCEADRAALKKHRTNRKTHEQKKTLYGHLRNAFGKNGIPSLIIEQTLPEIEERANLILDRLTEGKTHVHLETLKDKKTGGTKETLEIKITDELGVARPYETFSGGEAFRVNFALRIALAQLLAERSGVRIRTLVIDEGFGTQDPQGIQNMIEAIRVIQDDFDKILVITHLNELKNAFPVRIEVKKDPIEGSKYQLITS